jgi:hypothetical protein
VRSADQGWQSERWKREDPWLASSTARPCVRTRGSVCGVQPTRRGAGGPPENCSARIQYLRSPPCRTIVSGSSVNQDEGNAKRRQALDITTRLDESWNPLPDVCIHSARVTGHSDITGLGRVGDIRPESSDWLHTVDVSGLATCAVESLSGPKTILIANPTNAMVSLLRQFSDHRRTQ